MERNSVYRVIGINKKPIPMTQVIIDLINNQAIAEGQPEGIMFGDINMHTTINDLDGSIVEHDPEVDNDGADDKSYETSDDSTMNDDHNLDDDNLSVDDPIMNNVDRQEDHFNVNNNANNGVVNMEEEVNEADDIINNNEEQGVGLKILQLISKMMMKRTLCLKICLKQKIVTPIIVETTKKKMQC